ncbi:MAG: glycosyltransferase, partial [Candidatus Omnitrophica bacterium]|nr:glycosyltransferase [Candidatus Omnitrophota bacterium]
MLNRKAPAKLIKFPEIKAVSEKIKRPFWSVMIPTHDRPKYLAETLISVISQDPGPDEMHIEVVDNCSKTDEAEKIVKNVGNNRISYYRLDQAASMNDNWNNCIQRARGHWVHILHDDDLVRPCFYERFRKALLKNQNVGAAFCRNLWIDDEGHWQSISDLERKTPGILENWLERIVEFQRIQPPSIVVKRSTYEELGGFALEIVWGLDWEMWKRIAARYAFWYEPEPLACYRLHQSALSVSVTENQKHISDLILSIEMGRAYLPAPLFKKLSRKARKNYSLFAIDKARFMLKRRDLANVILQARAAL